MGLTKKKLLDIVKEEVKKTISKQGPFAGRIKENLGPVTVESIFDFEMGKIMDKLDDLKIDKMVQQLKTVRSMLDDKTLNNESAAKTLEVHGVLMRSISRHLLEIANVLRNPPGAAVKDTAEDPGFDFDPGR